MSSLSEWSRKDFDTELMYAVAFASLHVRTYNLIISELGLDSEKHHGYEFVMAKDLARETMKLQGSFENKLIYIKSRLVGII